MNMKHLPESKPLDENIAYDQLTTDSDLVKAKHTKQRWDFTSRSNSFCDFFQSCTEDMKNGFSAKFYCHLTNSSDSMIA